VSGTLPYAGLSPGDAIVATNLEAGALETGQP
jgi:hypothetical protein